MISGQQADQHTVQHDGADRSNAEADQTQANPAVEDECQDGAAICAQRHPQSDFLRSLQYGECDDGVNPHRRQQQTESREGRHGARRRGAPSSARPRRTNPWRRPRRARAPDRFAPPRVGGPAPLPPQVLLQLGPSGARSAAAAADACCRYGRYQVSGGSPGSRASETFPTMPTTISQGVFGLAMRSAFAERFLIGPEALGHLVADHHDAGSPLVVLPRE